MSNDRYPWFDADRSYYGVEWDRAWRFGTAAGEIHRKMEWSDVAVTLESMWNHSRRDKSWYEALDTEARPHRHAGLALAWPSRRAP